MSASPAAPVVRRGVIIPSPHTDPATPRDPFVRARFELSPAVRAQIRGMSYKFGFDGFGSAVYHRTYSRLMADGRQEAWPDTILRVVDGVMSIRKDWYQRCRLPWDDARWQDLAAEMAVAFHQMNCLPPGRGLWAMGSNYVYERGAMAVTNCAYVDVVTLSVDLGWSMDCLMAGAGVGYECVPRPHKLTRPDGPEVLYVVPDTREGWVESFEVLMRSYERGTNPVVFDYTNIRPAGTPLKGLGGLAGGPAPLQHLHDHVRMTCERYIRGEFGSTRLVADLANGIGCCVVVGNIRRSALILVGSIHDEEFLSLKDYTKHPERVAWGYMSNNSVALETHEDFEAMPRIAAGIRRNGEPGFINRVAISKFGRFGREMPDRARGVNPCQPAFASVLTSDGIDTVGRIAVGDAVWTGQRWSRVVRKAETGVKPVFAYRTRAGTFYGTENHRVVQNGEKVEAADAESIDLSWCREFAAGTIDPADVMDGLVLGDGTVHRASNDFVALIVGKDDQDYFKSEVAPLLIEPRDGIKPGYWMVNTRITAAELPLTYQRTIPERFRYGTFPKMRGFLRGLFSANGSVVGTGGNARVTLKASSFDVIEAAQEMLSALGVRSYYTTNKAHDVEFANGTYMCRESYDLNIGPDRARFGELVGFVQGYKTARLQASLTERVGTPRKLSYEIVAVEPMGEMPVYDITVDADEHTYWTGGLLVSNCSEIPLESKEVCNLSEVFPTRCADDAAVFRAMRLATLYSSTVALLPTHSPETNRVIARNRRIGVSISGIAEWMDDIGAARMTRFMRDGYKVVRAENRRLAMEAGVPESIRVTTVKPSGSLSQVVGVSSGLHNPQFNYAIRRMRVGMNAPITRILLDAGYPHEPDINDPNNTMVFEFPIDQGGARKATDVSMWEQGLQVATLQREWSDNSVSVTINFDPEREADDLEHLLAQIAPMVKSVSVLPHTPAGVYAQSPYEEITPDEYRRRVAAIRPVDWSSFRGDGEDQKFCEGGMCQVQPRGNLWTQAENTT